MIKEFFKEWLVPSGFQKIIQNVRNKKQSSGLDARRFWNGEPTESPNVNIPIFKRSGLASKSFTLNNETRDAVLINPGEHLSFTLEEAPETKATIGIASLPQFGEKRRLGSVLFKGENRLVSQIDGIPQFSWNDVSIPFLGPELNVTNNGDAPLLLSHPMFPALPSVNEIQNIIVIVLDSLSTKAVGLYNEEAEVSATPNIDRFFQQSLIYENCFAVAEWTLPSLYSILSGKMPIEHGFTDLRNSVPDTWADNNETLAAILRLNNYSTLACSTAKVFTPAFGAHAGFERFFYERYPESDRTSLLITDRAVEKLEANPNGKNFIFLHYIDTHEPWIKPSYVENSSLECDRILDPLVEYETLKLGSGDSAGEPYFSPESVDKLDQRLRVRLKEVDRHLQCLFDYLSLKQLESNTAIVLTGDHGFAYDNMKRPLLADNRIHVPLMIKHPNFGGGRVTNLINQGLDLGPVIASFSNSQMPSGSSNLFHPFGEAVRPFVISESVFGKNYKIAIRDGSFTFHFQCRFDNKTNTILADEVIDIQIYSRLLNANVEPENFEFPDLEQRMLGMIFEHLKTSCVAYKFSSA